ncbi:MAG: zinc ABC transporter substrate-binding protein [Firmicutes bacterium]|nr:zinc ABC transporter substrate-binding protein [Bacillota bacterium]MDD4694387.1 zinc ABC transporter substrate-binding protein [Bacillota bacterium]
MIKKLNILMLVLCLSLVSIAKLRIVTSINILDDWLKVVGKDKVEVHTLITGLETPHTYSPRPSDALALNRADGFIGVGLGLESWLQPLIKSSAKTNLPIFYLAENIHLISEEEGSHDHSIDQANNHLHDHNPHVWLSLENAQQMVGFLAEILGTLDKDNSDFFNTNAEDYIHSLNELETKYKQKFSSLKDLRLVSYPASYPYLFQEMGIDEVARGEDTHGQEPSAKRIITLANLMKKSDIKTIVSEKQFFSPLPDALANETNAEIVYLSPLLIGEQSYLELMESNYKALYTALSRN